MIIYLFYHIVERDKGAFSSTNTYVKYYLKNKCQNSKKKEAEQFFEIEKAITEQRM